MRKGLKIGDRIGEGSRKGKVTAFHSKGTVDVQFEDMDYAIRRQLGNVKRINPRQLLRLYHRTSPTAAAQIYKTGKWKTKIVTSVGSEIYFSTFGASEQGGYGEGLVAIDIPEQYAHLDDEFPTGEQHYWVEKRALEHHGKLIPIRTNPRRRNGKSRGKPILIIYCGQHKLRGKAPVRRMYTKGLWEKYRAHAPKTSPHPDLDVYVLSAKYGLVPETAVICDYNTKLVPAATKKLKTHEKRSTELLPELYHQLLEATDYDRSRPIYVIGSKAYREALSLTGIPYVDLTKHPEFPGRHGRGGVGRQGQALIWFLHHGKRRNPQSVLIPPPPSEKRRIAELKRIQKQYKNRVVPAHLQEQLDERIGDTFNELLRSHGIRNQRKQIKEWTNGVIKHIRFHKDHFKAERPSELAQRKKIRFKHDRLHTAETPSYPSGHTTQAYFLALKLSEKYPHLHERLLSLANLVAQSRIDRGVHFPSDNEGGKLLAHEVFRRELVK